MAVPARQEKHARVALSKKAPTGQVAKHATVPANQNIPDGQGVHTYAPDAASKTGTRSWAQHNGPPGALNVPAGHQSHVPGALPGVVSTAHGDVHDEAPVGEDSPAAHAVHMPGPLW